MMDRATYLGLSGDPAVNTVGVYLEPGHPQRAATVDAVRRLAAEQGFPVQRARTSTAASARSSTRPSP